MQIAGRGSEDQVLCRNLFASFTSNLSNNVLVSMAHCWRSLPLVSNVWEVAPRSLFCAQNRLNVLWEVRFEYISFQANYRAYSNPGTQVGPSATISVVFHRRTSLELSSISGTDYVLA